MRRLARTFILSMGLERLRAGLQTSVVVDVWVDLLGVRVFRIQSVAPASSAGIATNEHLGAIAEAPHSATETSFVED